MAATDLITFQQVSALLTAIANNDKANKTFINGNAADLGALNTTAKTNLVAAINEVLAAVAGGSFTPDDANTTTTTGWSGQKITDEIVAAINGVIDGAPGAIDTLNELAAALGDDPNFAATITTALGNRLRFDAAQTLTAPQQDQALANLGIVRSPDDLAAAYNALLV